MRVRVISVLSAGCLLAAGTAVADEPLRLDAGQLDAVTAGSTLVPEDSPLALLNDRTVGVAAVEIGKILAEQFAAKTPEGTEQPAALTEIIAFLNVVGTDRGVPANGGGGGGETDNGGEPPAGNGLQPQLGPLPGLTSF